MVANYAKVMAGPVKVRVRRINREKAFQTAKRVMFNPAPRLVKK